MIKNIIFDLGNVLLDQKTISADAYLASILHISELDSKIFYSHYKKDAVSGLIPFRTLVKLYKEHFKNNLPDEEVVKRYIQLYVYDVFKVNRELLSLIMELKKKYKIYMMTNTLEPHFEHWKTLGFDEYFDRIFRSDADHFIKPEKQAYEYIVGEIGAKPEECVFIDDLPENSEGAAKIGIKGLIYTNNSNLITDLAKLGVI
jgi:putative hydrolase of the HAD superfamily